MQQNNINNKNNNHLFQQVCSQLNLSKCQNCGDVPYKNEKLTYFKQFKCHHFRYCKICFSRIKKNIGCSKCKITLESQDIPLFYRSIYDQTLKDDLDLEERFNDFSFEMSVFDTFFKYLKSQFKKQLKESTTPQTDSRAPWWLFIIPENVETQNAFVNACETINSLSKGDGLFIDNYFATSIYFKDNQQHSIAVYLHFKTDQQNHGKVSSTHFLSKAPDGFNNINYYPIKNAQEYLKKLTDQKVIPFFSARLTNPKGMLDDFQKLQNHIRQVDGVASNDYQMYSEVIYESINGIKQETNQMIAEDGQKMCIICHDDNQKDLFQKNCNKSEGCFYNICYTCDVNMKLKSLSCPHCRK